MAFLVSIPINIPEIRTIFFGRNDIFVVLVRNIFTNFLDSYGFVAENITSADLNFFNNGIV